MSDQRWVDAPPAGADGWREVWRDDRRYRAGGAIHNFLRRLFRRAGSAELDRQRDFNLVLLDLVRDAHAAIEVLRAEARADVVALQEDVQKGDESLAGDIASVRELIPVASRRNDALVAALDQKIETLAVRLRDLTNPTVATSSREGLRDDLTYRRLEDGLRGSVQEIRESLADYVALARDHQPVVDVGCGRGELLAMCRESGIAARGFDTNERSVADLRQLGLDVQLAAIPNCFGGIADNSLGTVVATHVVEHLPVEALFALYRQSSRTLKPGGLLILETPNAESLLVTGREFWRDPTHLAPRHPAALALLAREHGFEIVEMRPVHPFPEGAALAVHENDDKTIRRLVEAINARLFGPQDLRVILRKA